MISHWLTQGETSFSQLPSFRPFYRAKSSQSLAPTRRQACPHFSPLHNDQYLQTQNREQWGSRLCSPWARNNSTRKKRAISLIIMSTWLPQRRSSSTAHETLLTDQGLPRTWRTPLHSNGNMEFSHWLLWASICQGLQMTPYVWCKHSGCNQQLSPGGP